MHRHTTPALTKPAALLLAAAVALGLAACEPLPPEEQVAELRGDYTAELNSFNVRETPMVEESGMEVGDETEMADVDGPDEAEPAIEPAMEGEEVVEEMPMRQDVMLDVVLYKQSGDERLPGLTLDVSQVDAQENDKASYRIWVDTSTLNKGSRRAVSYVLEDVDFEEGDKFAVEVRPNVPPEVRDQYQEFADAAAGEGEGG